MSNLNTVDIKISNNGIHCSGCEARIQSLVSRFPGVKEVKAEHRTQLVRVTLDLEETSPEEIKEKLADLGYESA